MGVVTVLSGLAVPIGILVGAGPLGGKSEAVEIFNMVMWVANPFGMMALVNFKGLVSVIVLYILGTMASALCWGLLDAMIFRPNSRSES